MDFHRPKAYETMRVKGRLNWASADLMTLKDSSITHANRSRLVYVASDMPLLWAWPSDLTWHYLTFRPRREFLNIVTLS